MKKSNKITSQYANLFFNKFFENKEHHNMAHFLELFLVFFDFKKAAMIHASKYNFFHAIKIISKLDLFFELRFVDHPPPEQSSFIYISKQKHLAKKALFLEKNQNKKAAGELFGFPHCCISEFIKFETHYNTDQDNINHYINTCNNTTSDGPHPFYNNCINHGYNLISHIPCKWSCKNSVKVARKNLKAITKFLPELPQLFLQENHKFNFFSKLIIICFKYPINTELMYDKNHFFIQYSLIRNQDIYAIKVINSSLITVYDNNMKGMDISGRLIEFKAL